MSSMSIEEQIKAGIAIEKIRLRDKPSHYLLALVLEDLGDSLVLLSPLITTDTPWELEDYSSTGTNTIMKGAILSRDLPSKVEERWYLSRALHAHLSIFNTFLPLFSVIDLMHRRVQRGV